MGGGGGGGERRRDEVRQGGRGEGKGKVEPLNSRWILRTSPLNLSIYFFPATAVFVRLHPL